jgi:hypothetical protein
LRAEVRRSAFTNGGAVDKTRGASNLTDSPAVSIVIPFFNRIAWTREAIASAQSQTHDNIEIIVVDDGSTDDVEPIRAIAAQDSRVRYIRSENRRGPGAARNRGVIEATGQYIAFLDSDDVLTPDKIHRQVTAMEMSGVGFSHTSYSTMDESGEPTGAKHTAQFSGTVYPLIISNCPIAMPTVMASRSLLLKFPFKEDISYGEDICTWIDIAAVTPILGIDELLTRVRSMPSSASQSSSKAVSGNANIAFHIAVSEVHQAQTENLKRLLLDTVVLLDHDLRQVFFPEKTRTQLIGESIKAFTIQYWGIARGRLASISVLREAIKRFRSMVRKVV